MESNNWKFDNRLYNLKMGKKVCISRPRCNCHIIGPIKSTTMQHFFIFDCSCVEQSLRTLISEYFLKNALGTIFYVDIVSQFLSNCMDFVQEEIVFDKIENAYVHEYFVPPKCVHIEEFNVHLLLVASFSINHLKSVRLHHAFIVLCVWLLLMNVILF